MIYHSDPNIHGSIKPSKNKTGILLINTGSPDKPTEESVREYLGEFLSDPYVVQLPGWLWKPILKGIILRKRPQESAQKYQKIWTQDGSPLVAITHQQTELIYQALQKETDTPFVIGCAMSYRKPSIPDQLNALREAGVQQFLILPLFPQYSETTTGSIIQAVSKEIGQWKNPIPFEVIRGYHNDPIYIHAMAAHIKQFWETHSKSERILFSFHGIPESYSKAGDPYAQQCQETIELLVEALGLKSGSWRISFQSRFGPIHWLKPYTEQVLKEWGMEKISSASVFCPGFSADCLESIYEIEIETRKVYESAGGKGFQYIPALNTNPAYIQALVEILRVYL
jgi:protoporphyrin/coproporphyrin ferrochelatase